MCGILYWNITGMSEQDVESVEALSEGLAHRGPDAHAAQIIETDLSKHLLVFYRLAIVKLGSEGDQPLTTGDRHLVCNGQIYNYTTLARDGGLDLDPAALRSDVEVLLPLMSESAVSTDSEATRALAQRLDTVDGDFAAVLVTSGGLVTAVRDPVGVRPLFYAVDDTERPVAFASEAKALLGGPGVRAVHRFPPGHFWRSSDPGEFHRYTSIYNPCNKWLDQTPDQARRAVRNLLTEAVRKRVMHSERPLAFLCSGGVDSCIVVAIAHQLLTEQGRVQDMHVFCMRYDDRGSRSDDAFYAELFLKSLGVAYTVVAYERADIAKHYSEVVRVCETFDPNTVRAALPMYLLARYIAQATPFKVLLSGEVSDEVMCGYDYFRQVPDAAAANDESARLVQNIHSFDVLRADRCFMAHGLEIRVPFADRDFLAHMFRTDGRLRSFQNGVEKALLRDAFADVQVLSTARVLDRPKERASDGVGFSYVPHLLAYACHSVRVTTSRLEEKEAAERKHCRQLFTQHYGPMDGLIIPREMPSWCKRGDTRLLAA